jgi:hypothetical protein
MCFYDCWQLNTNWRDFAHTQMHPKISIDSVTVGPNVQIWAWILHCIIGKWLQHQEQCET